MKKSQMSLITAMFCAIMCNTSTTMFGAGFWFFMIIANLIAFGINDHRETAKELDKK
jgi:hypothetical protein